MNAKPERTLVAEGGQHDIWYAVRADGSEPARDYINQLGGADEGADLLPDERVGRVARAFEEIEHWAEHGCPSKDDRWGYLNSGLWEIKAGTSRISFFSTEGDGTFNNTGPYNNRAESEFPDHAFWDIPTLDIDLRLGYSFDKASQKTEPSDILLARTVREEDLQHDRQRD